MIAHVNGILAEVFGSCCIILTPGGVGYRLFLPGHTLNTLPPKGESVAMYTSMAVREDALELYGFASFEERQTFEILRSINKIGPKAALAVLSAYRPGELKEIANSDNLAALRRIPGIGPKTAQHLLLELKDKLKTASASNVSPSGVRALPDVQRDVLAALMNLGYTEEECWTITVDIFKTEPDLDVGSGIRMALKALARGNKR